MADDIPHYWITDYDRRHTLLMLPYYYAMDTQFFMFFPGVGKGSGLVQTRALWENWAAELEGVRAWGRQSTFVIQPYLMQFGAGPGRAGQAHAGGYGCPRSLERHFWSVRGLLEAGLSRGSDAAFREGRVA